MTNFYLFEGVDGSGKTVLAEEFAREINGIYYANPPEVVKFLRKEFDRRPAVVRYYYYLLCNAVCSGEVSELLKEKDVVCDRYFPSTLAYHSALLNRDLSKEGNVFDNLLQPNYIIHCQAQWAEIDKRLSEREKRSPYEDLELLKQSDGYMTELFEGKQNVLTIDTTNRIVNELVRELLFKFKPEIIAEKSRGIPLK